jgi:hypothetical protein
VAIGVGALVGLIAVAGLAYFWHLAGRSQDMAEAAAREPFPLADCAALQRPTSPNHWLVGAGDCAANADAAAPVLQVSAEALATRWHEWLPGQKGVRVMPAGEDPLQITAIASSDLFGFADVVAIKVKPLEADSSTVSIYSRSMVGESDLDANRKRVEAWLNAISK